MDRKEFFLKFKKEKRQYAPFRPAQTGIDPYTGPWTYNEVSHLLKRTMFGAKKQDVDYFLNKNINDAVDELITNVTVSPPLRDYGLLEVEGIKYDDLGVPVGSTWINDYNTKSAAQVIYSINGARKESLLKWWTGLILNQNRSIAEKMILFWHHHFSVQEINVFQHYHLYRHHNLLRQNALGNVRQLVKDVTIDPAMLSHLNGNLNSQKAPDENFAREVQELMTVGLTTNGYTEKDVIEAARVLTGWRILENATGSYLSVDEHDKGTKTFSSFYKNKTITGNTNGTAEVDAFVDMLFDADETAKFICRKIYRWFVYYTIDETTEANVIAPLAAIFKNNNFEIKPVLLTLFKSEHFFDPLNQSCYIKTPFDFVAGALRELNAAIPPYTDYIKGYPFFEAIHGQTSIMQQTLFAPPDVSGWPSYHQDPMFYELWIHSNSLPKRAKYTDSLVDDGIVDVKQIAVNSSNPSNPNQLMDDLIKLLLRYPLSVNSKNYLKTKFLTNNTGNDSYWTNAWNNNDNTIINDALKGLLKFIMNLPEYHLC